MIRHLLNHWDWMLCGTVLLCLSFFLLGYDGFGLNGTTASILALVGGVLATVVGFIMAAFVLPLVGLITAVIGAFVGLVTVLLAFAVGGIFTPIAAALVGGIYALFGWLATTWLGTTLLMPLYSTLGPLILQVAPWLTTSKFLLRVYDWLDDQPWWPRALVFTRKMKKAKGTAKGISKKNKKRPGSLVALRMTKKAKKKG